MSKGILRPNKGANALYRWRLAQGLKRSTQLTAALGLDASVNFASNFEAGWFLPSWPVRRQIQKVAGIDPTLWDQYEPLERKVRHRKEVRQPKRETQRPWTEHRARIEASLGDSDHASNVIVMRRNAPTLRPKKEPSPKTPKSWWASDTPAPYESDPVARIRTTWKAAVDTYERQRHLCPACGQHVRQV